MEIVVVVVDGGGGGSGCCSVKDTGERRRCRDYQMVPVPVLTRRGDGGRRDGGGE